jgi:hypothetical protein
MAGLDPATHAFAALNPPRVLLERRNYIPSDFCEVVANVDSSLRHAAWMAKPGQDVQARGAPATERFNSIAIPIRTQMGILASRNSFAFSWQKRNIVLYHCRWPIELMAGA